MDTSVPAIEAFVDELITRKFGDTMPDAEAVTQIKKELTERLNQYMTLRTIEIISMANPQAVQKLSDLVRTNPKPEEVQTFIRQYVTEPDVLVAQIFTDFRNLYLGIEVKKTN